MRLGDVSMMRRTTFCRQARAGRVDDDDVGAPAPSRPARAARAGRRRRRSARRSMPFARALSIASATACSTTSMPHSSPARARERQARRADAAVEVVDALPALERRELAGDAVEPLGHLGVRLEERLRRDREAQPARAPRGSARRPTASIVRPPLRGLADAVGPRPQQAVAAARPRRALSTSISPGPVHEAHADLPGPAPLADDEVAQQPGVRAAVERARGRCARAHASTALARLVAALGGEQAVARRRRSPPTSRARGSRR